MMGTGLTVRNFPPINKVSLKRVTSAMLYLKPLESVAGGFFSYGLRVNSAGIVRFMGGCGIPWVFLTFSGAECTGSASCLV